jgi:hypothetical protein
VRIGNYTGTMNRADALTALVLAAPAALVLALIGALGLALT